MLISGIWRREGEEKGQLAHRIEWDKNASLDFTENKNFSEI
jgi:hypothetical protein